MILDPLERTILLSHVHGRLVILDEDIDVGKAFRQMHSQKAII